MDVLVLNRQRTRSVTPEGLRRFLSKLSGELPAESVDSLAVQLVSDRRMRHYNKTFRGHTTTTDVLAFPADSLHAPLGERHLGDIVISVPVAAAQARRAGHSLPRELRVLALHGYLHLLGYDHESDDGAMMRLQRRLERRLFASTPEGRRR